MSKPLRGRTITQVLATSSGGVGTHVSGVSSYLVEAGADLRVLGPQDTQDLFAFTDTGARFAPAEIPNGLRAIRAVRAARSVRRATTETDLIHAHGLRAATVAAAANLRRSTPLVVTLHNSEDTVSAMQRRVRAVLERFVARQADVVIGASKDLVASAREGGARKAVFREVAAPAMSPPERTAEEVRQELRIDNDTPLLLCIGRLHVQKGYDTLLEAARIWNNHPAQPEVVIAGDGPLEDELRAEIDESQIRVHLLGHRTDVPDLLGAADMVLLPSVWEARSLVAQEAMRAGVALVSTTVGGMSELIGDAAYRVPVGDAQALADAVCELIDDPERRAALAEAGRARSAQFPTESDTAAALIEIYRHVLDQGQRA